MTRDVIAVWAESHHNGQPVMGDNSKPGLPWPTDPEDLQHFRRATRNRVMVMGRKTFEDLPDALKTPKSTFERPLIVLTHEPYTVKLNVRGYWYAGTYESPEDLVRFAKAVFPWASKGIAFIGGPGVIEWAEPVIEHVYTSFVRGPVAGDVPAPWPGLDLTARFPRETLLGTTRSGTMITRYDREVPKTPNEQELAA